MTALKSHMFALNILNLSAITLTIGDLKVKTGRALSKLSATKDARMRLFWPFQTAPSVSSNTSGA
jgi:hypothetical protein